MNTQSWNVVTNDRKPYTYLITHISTGMRYYGSRYRKSCDPKELGTGYISSQKLLRSLIIANVEDFKFEVRKVFTTAKAAHDWEIRFLKKINAATRDDWFNKSNGDSMFFSSMPGRENPMFGNHSPKSEIHKKRISEGLRGKTSEKKKLACKKNLAKATDMMRGKPKPHSQIENMRQAALMRAPRTFSVEAKANMRRLRLEGPKRFHTEEYKKAMSIRMKGENNPMFGKCSEKSLAILKRGREIMNQNRKSKVLGNIGPKFEQSSHQSGTHE